MFHLADRITQQRPTVPTSAAAPLQIPAGELRGATASPASYIQPTYVARRPHGFTAPQIAVSAATGSAPFALQAPAPAGALRKIVNSGTTFPCTSTMLSRYSLNSLSIITRL